MIYSESSELGTDDISIYSSTDEDFIPTSSRRGTSRTSTTTLSRTGTTSRRGTSRPAFYLQGNHALQRETPPSLRWTPSVTQWRTSCPNCGHDIHTNSSPAVPPFAPRLNRSNATVGSTHPNTPPTVSSYRGRFKTGWTQNLRKRYVFKPPFGGDRVLISFAARPLRAALLRVIV